MELESYIENVREGSRKYYSQILGSFAEWLGERGKDIDEAEYDEKDVRRFLDHLGQGKLGKREWKSSSLNTVLAIIKTFAGWQSKRLAGSYDKPSVKDVDSSNPSELMRVVAEREEIDDEIEGKRSRLGNVRDIKRRQVFESTEKNVLTLDQDRGVAQRMPHSRPSRADPLLLLRYAQIGTAHLQKDRFREQ